MAGNLFARTHDWQLTEDSLKMVRDQVLVVTEKGESETDAGIVIAASVSVGVDALWFWGNDCMCMR